ncbi:pyridoxamine 5'-phosphate oxidase family protein [Deinococcus sp. QL22]|uniref:pyridoxamine 5'-phosphate oxidase family protein n=1 Tax=Deinococcus sp. QL22 TaxID=2939437 RepID=UPI0020172C91|nr:pyridoxamine 5'-phosphate oxidase family protein [Deinococcus sp. QL22]UQN06353.1 pyridoxamine 5'-phosphate oxidase family protein [Deinococcus sp. QL22]
MSDQNSDQNATETTPEQSIKAVAAIIKDVKFAMLTTVTSEGRLHSRPMTTQEQEFDGDIWFLGNKDAESTDDMRHRPEVNLSFSNPEKGNYVSLTGRAELVEDRAKLDELWNDFYKTYFEGGKEDPNIQLIKIHAHGAEYWESDGRLRSFIQMAKGAITGKQQNMGKNDTVSL